jgi:hypothetical protein
LAQSSELQSSELYLQLPHALLAPPGGKLGAAGVEITLEAQLYKNSRLAVQLPSPPAALIPAAASCAEPEASSGRPAARPAGQPQIEALGREGVEPAVAKDD